MSVDEDGTFQARPAGALETDSGAMARRQLAIGYVRVASVSQVCPRFALDGQIAQVQAIAEAVDVELIGIIEDSGESALNMNRTGLLKVLAAANEGHIDVVIVEDLFRLARDPEDLRHILDSFSSRGVVVMHGRM
ncbi:MAG: recombinase family protein [Bryobacteraceae bacterium]|jgi:DNA invertase Pin-like site-specific DNA recombinase